MGLLNWITKWAYGESDRAKKRSRADLNRLNKESRRLHAAGIKLDPGRNKRPNEEMMKKLQDELMKRNLEEVSHHSANAANSLTWYDRQQKGKK